VDFCKLRFKLGSETVLENLQYPILIVSIEQLRCTE